MCRLNSSWCGTRWEQSSACFLWDVVSAALRPISAASFGFTHTLACCSHASDCRKPKDAVKLKDAALHKPWCLATVHFCKASISFFFFFFFSSSRNEREKKNHILHHYQCLLWQHRVPALPWDLLVWDCRAARKSPIKCPSQEKRIQGQGWDIHLWLPLHYPDLFSKKKKIKINLFGSLFVCLFAFLSFLFTHPGRRVVSGWYSEQPVVQRGEG